MIFTSGTSSVLLNGIPRKVFHCLRGVRQGDPLSPLLFVLRADFLQTIINDAMNNGFLQLPIPLPEMTDFPILQYADDTLIFMQADVVQLAHLQSLLQSFADSSGLKVNFDKSLMIPINVDEAHPLHIWACHFVLPNLQLLTSGHLFLNVREDSLCSLLSFLTLVDFS
jgi:hypothetical protein